MTKITDSLSDIANIDLLVKLKSISGLVVTPNAGAPTTHIDVSVGTAVDSTKTYLLDLTSAFTKDLSLTFAAGTGNGGYYTSGGLPVSSKLPVFIIRKDSDGSKDVYVDTSTSAANIPAGYTAYARCGWVLTDSGGLIINYTAVELAGGAVDVEYKAAISELSSVATSITRALVAVTAPPNTVGVFYIRLNYQTAATSGWVKSTNYIDAASTSTNEDLVVVIDSHIATTIKKIIIDASSQVAYRASSTGSIWYLNTQGYIDRRIN